MVNQAMVESQPQETPAPQAPAIESGKTGFAANVVSNLAFMFTQMLVSLWYTPFLIGSLGIAAYGIVPLANSVTAYVSLLTYSFTSAVTRFLTIDLAGRNPRAANATFNTAFFSIAGLAALLLPVVLTISLAFPYIFNVPAGLETDARWLFLFVACTFLLSIIISTFSVSAYAHSKFLLINIVRFAELSTRVGLVVVLFSLFSARVWHVGAGIFTAVLVTLTGQVILWRKLTPELGIHASSFDRSRLRSLLGMGGWFTVERAGFLLLNNTNLMIVNLVFDAATTGAYGSLMQFPTLVDAVATTTTSVLHPAILKKYAQGDAEGLKRLGSQAVKLLGLVIALPVGLLCGFSRPFLSVWLGPSFQHLDILLIFLVSHLSVNLSIVPLGFIENAYNRVRWPGIVTLLTGAVNLGMAVLVAKWGRWGAVGVALTAASSMALRSVLFMPLYNAYIMKQRWWVFYPSLAASIVGTLLVGLLAYGATQLWMPTNWLALGILGIGVSLLYGVSIFLWGLTRDDWSLIVSILPSPTNRALDWFLHKTNKL